MRHLPLAALLLSLPAQAFGPTTPPPGWTGPASDWAKVYRRAETFARVAKGLLPTANEACIHAKLLEFLGENEVGASADSVAQTSLATGDITVHPRGAKDFTRAIQDEVKRSCGGPGAGSLADDAVALMYQRHPEWDVQGFGGINALRGAAGAGVGMSVSRSAAVPATPLIIVDPKRLPDVRPPAVRKTRPDDVM